MIKMTVRQPYEHVYSMEGKRRTLALLTRRLVAMAHTGARSSTSVQPGGEFIVGVSYAIVRAIDRFTDATEPNRIREHWA